MLERLLTAEARERRTFPAWVTVLMVVVTSVALIPPFVIYRARTATSRDPRVHIWHDMDNQPRFKAQQPNTLFLDGRAMRPPVEGTVARGELHEDRHYFSGRRGDAWAAGLPARLRVNSSLLARGRERYEIFCAPCHGSDGGGVGPVGTRAEGVNQAAIGTEWTVPTNLAADDGDQSVPRQPLGKIFNTITHGIRNMPGYGAQIPVGDRWAISAYVRALQRSQSPLPGDVPPEIRRRLEQGGPQALIPDSTEGSN